LLATSTEEPEVSRVVLWHLKPGPWSSYNNGRGRHESCIARTPMLRFMFRCPKTAYIAQGVVPSKKTGDKPRYRLVRCAACRGTHFVDPATGEAIAATKNPDDDDETRSDRKRPP
jgi:hypothetical protein